MKLMISRINESTVIDDEAKDLISSFSADIVSLIRLYISSLINIIKGRKRESRRFGWVHKPLLDGLSRGERIYHRRLPGSVQ